MKLLAGTFIISESEVSISSPGGENELKFNEINSLLSRGKADAMS